MLFLQIINNTDKLMNKKITLGLLMLLACLELSAVPALNVRKKVMLEDGTMVMATLQGDEFYNYFITDDGRVLNATASGKYRVVSELVHSKARSVADRRLAEANSLRAKSLRRNTESTNETRRGIVILAQFQDVKFSQKGTADFYNRLFNEKGFSHDGSNGSVSDYFYDQSYGKLTYEFDVVGPVTLPNNLAYYGAHDEASGANDARPLDFAADACTAAKDLADFSKYDYDNDGVVDNVFILFAGYSEAMGAAPECIWPHQWAIFDRDLVIDGMAIFNYACSNELMWSEGEELSGIGTACHEFSHTLGLMDTYNTKGGKEFVGQWDLMSGGSYNGENYGSGTDPVAYTAYERWSLGWLEPTELTEQTEVTGMKPIEDNAEAYVLYNEGNRNEYYLLENRQLKKWGRTIGAHGLMVSHVDYDYLAWASNVINADDEHPRFEVVSACNDIYGEVLYPGTTGNTSLTNTSTPAATLFNPNDDGGTLLNKPVVNITEGDDGTISFVACSGVAQRYDSEITAILNADGTIACQWDAVADALSYDVKLSATVSNPSPCNHAIMEENFDNVPKEDGTDDIGSLLRQYVGNYWSGGKVYSAEDGIRIASDGGYIYMPPFKLRETNSATMVFDMAPYVNGDTPKGYICLYDMDNNLCDWWEVSMDKKEKIICNASIVKGNYYYILAYAFTAPVCLSGVSIYDGIFEADDFTGTTEPTQPAETLTPEEVNTSNTSIAFSDIKKGYNYSVSVRSHLADGRTTMWSQPVAVDMTSDVDSVISDALPSHKGEDAIYDITGRRVASASRPGIYIRSGKKIVVGNGK